MGSLHEGHISLIKFAEKKSIYYFEYFCKSIAFDDKKDLVKNIQGI